MRHHAPGATSHDENRGDCLGLREAGSWVVFLGGRVVDPHVGLKAGLRGTETVDTYPRTRAVDFIIMSRDGQVPWATCSEVFGNPSSALTTVGGCRVAGGIRQ